jgi:FtsH-binding integral membrane protein
MTRDAAGTLLGQTMGLVAVTAGLFAVGAYVGRNLAYQWGWLLFIAAFACLIGMNVATQRSEGLTVTLLFGFGLLIGLAVAPTLSYYASADPQAVWQAGGATALFIAGFGAAGYATRRDLSAARPHPLLGPDRADPVRHRYYPRRHPERCTDLGGPRSGGFRGPDGVRLPAPSPQPRHPNRSVARGSIFLDILNVFLLLLSLFGGGDD